MITQKRRKLTAREVADAYELATVRDLDACQMPGAHIGAAQRDHRQNRDPFNTVVENLQCLCLVHHAQKTQHPDWANREGWGVPRWANPAAYPARRLIPTTVGTRRLAWILYVPDIEFFSHPLGYREIDELEAEARRAGLWEGVAA